MEVWRWLLLLSGCLLRQHLGKFVVLRLFHSAALISQRIAQRIMKLPHLPLPLSRQGSKAASLILLLQQALDWAQKEVWFSLYHREPFPGLRSANLQGADSPLALQR
jgi:hypothetical protein